MSLSSMMRARHALVAAAAVAGLMAGGCADSRWGADTAQAVDPADSAAASELLGRLKQQIFGTGEQRTAGSLHMWRQIQGAIAGCMAAAGKRYGMPEHVDITVPPEEMAVGDFTAFAPVRSDSWGIAERQAMLAQAGEPTNPAFAQVSPGARADYTAALVGCQDAGGKFTDAGTAHGYEELASKLEEVLLAVENSGELAGHLDDYAACLKDKGMTATTWSELRQQVERAFPPNPEKPTDIRTDPAYVRAAELERAAVKADSACREQLHDYALAMALPALREFEKDNNQALRDVSAEWLKLEKAVEPR